MPVVFQTHEHCTPLLKFAKTKLMYHNNLYGNLFVCDLFSNNNNNNL